MHPYTDDFYGALEEGTRSSAVEIVPILLGIVQPRHVVDVGCGRGAWLAVFGEHGIEDVCGVDGEWVAAGDLHIAPDRFVARDLAGPISLGKRFDLVLALEVAEHLAAECAATFVASLTELGDLIAFSAAIPFQGGYNHLNEQWPDYWADLFAARHYQPVDCIRQRIWDNDRVFWWYAQNLVLYVREDLRHSDRYAFLPALSDQRSPLALVHPRKYLSMIG